MDFSKPIRAPGTLTRTPNLDIPGLDDADSGAGSDFRIEDNILPESAGKAHNVPNPMSIIGPGAAMPSLASKLCWRTR